MTLLIADRRSLLNIPQHVLYYKQNPPDNPSTVDDGDDKSDQTDSLDPGNTTLSTIASATSTEHMRIVKEIIPDFAIIRMRSRLRNPARGRVWENLKIKSVGVPILVEVKPAASRSLTGLPSLESTAIELARGQTQAMRQAAYLFRMNERQDSVILMACSGIYWTCRIARRDSVMHMAPMDPDVDVEGDMDNEDSDEDEGEMDEEDEENEDEGEEEDDDAYSDLRDDDDDDDDIDELDIMHLPEGELAWLELVQRDEDNLALPQEDWTLALIHNTSASNQHFYMIHYRLDLVLAGNHTMG